MSLGRVPLATERAAGPSALRRLSLFLAAATVLLLGSGLISLWSARPADRPADPVAVVPGAAGSPTDRTIALLQARLQERPDSPSRVYSQLGAAYLQKAREIADPAYYTKSDAVLTKALTIAPDDFSALISLGVLALARHDFRGALGWGERARAINPYNAGVYGILGDARVELGDYPAAEAAFQEMMDRRPDSAAYARASYLRELYGDIDGAFTAMRQAAENGGVTGENAAWYRVQTGHLAFNYTTSSQGGFDAADVQYRSALEADPANLYALAGLARTRAARGDYDGAIDLYTRVTQIMPLPEFVIALGDVYTAAGRPEDAARQYDLVAVIDQLFRANGVNNNLELALFNADHADHGGGPRGGPAVSHGGDLPGTLARARQIAAERPSVKAVDVLAWTLYQSGDYPAAWEASRQALRLGTQDALMFFHAGLIARAVGDTTAAQQYLERALATNPAFSLVYAPTARQALAEPRAPTTSSPAE